MFKVNGTVETLPGRGKKRKRKRKLSMAATKFLRRQDQKNPQAPAKDLQQDLVAACNELSACTEKHVLNACQNSKKYKSTRKVGSNMLKII